MERVVLHTLTEDQRELIAPEVRAYVQAVTNLQRLLRLLVQDEGAELDMQTGEIVKYVACPD